MLDESDIGLHHGAVEHASQASILFRGNIGRTILFPCQLYVAHDAGKISENLLHIQLSLVFQLARDGDAGLWSVRFFGFGVSVIHPKRLVA